MTLAADDTMEITPFEITPYLTPSNLGARNLFCYLFLRSDHILVMQTTKNQNMAGTKVQTSKA